MAIIDDCGSYGFFVDIIRQTHAIHPPPFQPTAVPALAVSTPFANPTLFLRDREIAAILVVPLGFANSDHLKKSSARGLALIGVERTSVKEVAGHKVCIMHTLIR